MTSKENRFIEEFCKDFNATRAAKDSGYSTKSATEIGYENLRKPHIKDEIAKRLDALSMESGEITKRITNLARGDMSDYMSTRLVPYTPRVKMGLDKLILGLQKEIDFEDNYALQVNLDEEELEAHMAGQKSRRRKIIRYKLELDINPYASRIVDGETVMVDDHYLDLGKIIKDKERGIIKSYKNTKDGIQVELYNAEAALAQMAKIRGLLIDKSEIDLNATVDTVVRIGYGGKEIQ